MEKIVILTGAGISAESGLATFRDEGGLWAAHRIEDVATPEAFERDPDLVHRFYNARRTQAARVAPNAAHRALARLQERHGGEVVLVTQNVDALHEAAGSRAVMHMHGTLAGALCARCEARWPAPLVMSTQDACPVCGAKATRPDIVWFGEMPHGMEAIWTHLEEADVFAAIGTSGNVYPAAAFAQHAGRAGAHTIELNLEASYNTRDFAETRLGRASQVVPEWVGAVLGD
ncbi:NAD-dependent deacylase [Roseovarius sp.]|uniref:NAD-dependent deacylase n=1 Tax=Roseovarius sp. TaxID=1486281 RepID=UPI002605123D|nr:NAD-dependent deacylase [Roseovarius sp.]